MNEIAARVRAEVNAGMFGRVLARMAQGEVSRVDRLLEVGSLGIDRWIEIPQQLAVVLDQPL